MKRSVEDGDWDFFILMTKQIFINSKLGSRIKELANGPSGNDALFRGTPIRMSMGGGRPNMLELINLVKSFLESLVSKLTSSLVVLHHLVVEDGEVERETELDWVARRKRDLVGFLVCL